MLMCGFDSHYQLQARHFSWVTGFLLGLWDCCGYRIFGRQWLTARDSAARDVISHKREEKHDKKSVGHTKWHTKSVENTVQKAENIAARSHGCGGADLWKILRRWIPFHVTVNTVRFYFYMRDVFVNTVINIRPYNGYLPFWQSPERCRPHTSVS